MNRRPPSSRLHRVALAVVVASSCVTASAQTPSRVPTFDGDWSVHLDCADTQDARGLVKGYQFVFGAKIVGGRIDGQYGSPDTSPSLHLTGEVREGGVLEIVADGISGAPEYVVGRKQGTPYHYSMTGSLDGSHGVATRREIRPCTATFARGTGPIR